MSDDPSAGFDRSTEHLERLRARWGATERDAEIEAEEEARLPMTVLLVWEGSDIRGIYADTEKGRAAAERLRASIQAEYAEMDRGDGREPREYSFIYVHPERVSAGEEPDGE